MSKLSDTDLLAAVSAAEAAALGSQQGDISSDRADAIDRYLGKPYGNEVAGRSSIVSRDVSDVVEGVLANVLKPFVGGDKVVQFDPRGPEDEQQAEQETDYVNFVALERNNGFLVMNSAVKDALLLRAGYVKCYWHKRDDVVVETYQGLSDDELAAIANDKDVEVVAHSEYPDPYFAPQPMGPQPAAQAMAMGQGPASPPQPQQAPMLHDLKVRRARPTEYVKIDPVPPDEMRISVRSRGPSLQDIDFIQHATNVTLSDLRQMGYDVDDDIASSDDPETIEDIARMRFGQRNDVWADETSDPSRRIVMFKESWMRIDYDGDGVAELRRICQVGENLLANEETDIIPFACFSAVLMPHQHLGLSVYDLVQDLAQIKTALVRQFMDNKYLANNARTVVDINRVNLDDLLVSRPGGVIRAEGNPAEIVMPLITPDTGVSALQGLEYLDTIRENRTGYTKAAEGVRSDSLATNTLGELQQQMSQSSLRLEMISRTIAETGMRDMFRIVHALTLKHSTREEKVRLRSKWVLVNPREWVRRTDLSISVGLGNASASSQIQNLSMILTAQEKVMGMGIANPQNVYNALNKLANASGFKNPDEFFTAPDPNNPPKPPPNPMLEVEKVKQQANMQSAQMKAQVDMQISAAKAQQEQQLEAAKMQANAAKEQAQMQADLQTQQHQAAMTSELELSKARMQMELDNIKHQRDQQTAIQVAEIQANASITVAHINAEAKAATAEKMANRPAPSKGM